MPGYKMGMPLSWLSLILTWLLISPIDDLILVIVFFLASPSKSKSSPLFLVLVLTLNSCSSLWRIVWLRWLLVDKGVHLDTLTPLYCDNKKLLKLPIMKFSMNVCQCWNLLSFSETSLTRHYCAPFDVIIRANCRCSHQISHLFQIYSC